MKLSTAMMLGRVTCKMKEGDIDSCAYGAALNAMGVPTVRSMRIDRYAEIIRLWPWTGEINDKLVCFNSNGANVYRRFDWEVCRGKLTYEQLVDWVKSVEPECECNRFNCSCEKVQPLDEACLEPVLS